MKKIEAIIKPFKLDDVKEALERHRHPGNDDNGSQGIRPSERATRKFTEERNMWLISFPK